VWRITPGLVFSVRGAPDDPHVASDSDRKHLEPTLKLPLQRTSPGRGFEAMLSDG
jgi:hypothetical protein